LLPGREVAAAWANAALAVGLKRQASRLRGPADDPHTVPPGKIKDIRIVRTVTGGSTVHQAA